LRAFSIAPPSFVSLLLAVGRRPGEVAEQAGHSLAVFQDTYAHVITEFRGVAVSDPADESPQGACVTGASSHPRGGRPLRLKWLQ
jgi:hypothetical protein